MERSIALAFTTRTVLVPPAHAAHPTQAVQPEGAPGPLEFVATASRAQGRVLYLDRDGAIHGSFCRQRQNSVARRGVSAAGGNDTGQYNPGFGIPGGCSAGGGSSHGAIALALLALCRRRRR